MPIQVKRYTGRNRVNTREVKNFHERMQKLDEDFDRLLLVTTNTLTRDARRCADVLGIDVMNGPTLCSQILQADALT